MSHYVRCCCCAYEFPVSYSFPRSICDRCEKEAVAEVAQAMPEFAEKTKIRLIKAVKNNLGIGLKPAKNLVEACLYPGAAVEIVSALLATRPAETEKSTTLRVIGTPSGKNVILEMSNDKVLGIWEMEDYGHDYTRREVR